MPSYRTFSTGRPIVADPTALLVAMRAAIDETVAIGGLASPYTIKKATQWTAPQIDAAQIVLDTVLAASPQRTAQLMIDQWPIELKAAFILIMEQINVLRAFHSLPAFTAQQFVGAIKTKAGTL